MGKNLIKGVPLHWDPNNSYLLLEESTHVLSYGKVLTRYTVIKRWTRGGYGEPGKFTNSLKGCEYTPSEIKIL